MSEAFLLQVFRQAVFSFRTFRRVSQVQPLSGEPVPLATITMICVGSHYENLHRLCREPTKTKVLVVEGKGPLGTMRGYEQHVEAGGSPSQ